MSKNESATWKRSQLLRQFTEMHLSASLSNRICQIIGSSRLSGCDEAAEAKAAEMTALINRCKTEDEIVKALETMQK